MTRRTSLTFGILSFFAAFSSRCLPSASSFGVLAVSMRMADVLARINDLPATSQPTRLALKLQDPSLIARHHRRQRRTAISAGLGCGRPLEFRPIYLLCHIRYPIFHRRNTDPQVHTGRPWQLPCRPLLHTQPKRAPDLLEYLSCLRV